MKPQVNRVMIQEATQSEGGILRLGPTWVGREFPSPGKRLGLPDDAYDLGERGANFERWLGSTTNAVNRIGPSDEGLNYIVFDGKEISTLEAAIQVAGDLIMGLDYAKTHRGLGRLAKIFDYADRIFSLKFRG